ncbi:MAG: hypothetical protein HY363_01085 [Candidatus Aenigmarchaeota archaeon]|nr:hypothetical protein [Candidatus Aenigmarchaeota archaeon]
MSKKSKIIELTKQDVLEGVILDTPDEFEQALRLYAAGIGNKTAQNWTEDDIKKPDNPQVLQSQVFATAFALKLKQETDEYIQNSITEMKKELVCNGSCERRFDHDAGGTRFYKTSVYCIKVDDKYVLKVRAAHVGNDPELKLAEFLKKPVGVSACEIVCKLSTDKDANYLIDLEMLLKPIKKFLDDYHWMNLLSRVDFARTSEFEFEHNGQIYYLCSGVDAFQSTKTNYCISGKALAKEKKWNYEEQKLETIDVIVQPSLHLAVRPTQEFEQVEKNETMLKRLKAAGMGNTYTVRGRRPYPLLKIEEIQQMQETRDYVYELFNAKLKIRK